MNVNAYISMSWSELPTAHEGEVLELKGFLFQAPDGRWILSAEPNLKSCCVGATHKRSTQVTLLGDFSTYSTTQPLEVKGVCHTSAQGYCLSEISVAQKQGSFPIWTVAALFAFCLILFGVKKLKRLLLP